MKKTVSILMVSALLCSLFTFVPASAAGVSIVPDKTAYTLKEEMKITVTGVTEAMEDASAFVSVTKAKARPSDYGTWKYASDLYETDGVWTVEAPDEAGNYEIRFYEKDGDYDNSLTVRVPVTISYVTDQTLGIKPDKAAYTPKEEMKVTVTGYTAAMEKVNAFVSYTKKNARLEDYGTWKYVSDLYETDGIWTVNAPDDVGEYEFRLYAADKDYANSLAKTVPLNVTYSTLQTGVTPDRTTVRPNDTVIITVTGVTEAQKQASAFVSITKKNARPEDYGIWKYVIDLDITNGVWAATAPADIGEYEIRLYAKDGDYTDDSIIARATLAVSTDAASTQTQNQPVSGSVSPGQNGVSEWAVSEINEAIDDGLVTDKVTVEFQRSITREEFCELAVKLYEAITGKKAAPSGSFTDTSNPEILKAVALGIVNGVGDGKFAPGSPVTHQEIAVMLLRTIQAGVPSLDTSVNNPPVFADAGDIAFWAVSGVNYFASKDIIKGANGAFLPLANCTCEAAIALVKRVFDAFSVI